MNVSQAQQRVEPWLAPLPGDNPCGEDARYDQAHEAVRAEVAKLGSPAAGEVQWGEVVRQGGELLSQRSKDLLIASYAAQGLYEEEGLAGLLGGVVLLKGLLEASWEGLYPSASRLKARAAALQWFVERAASRLAVAPLEARDAAAVLALVEQVDGLAAAAQGRLGEQAPAFGPLVRALEQQRLSLPEGALAEASEPATAAAQVPVETGAGSEVQVPVDAPPGVEPTPQADTEAPQDPRASLRDLAQTWLAPISVDAPCGAEARYDPIHEGLRATVQQLDSPTGQPVQWDKVLGEGRDLIQAKSKDLLIAGYVTYALLKEEGLGGLTTGLAGLAGLLEDHWDGLFPSQRRNNTARAAALSWLLRRLEGLAETPVTASDRDAVEQLDAAANWFVEQVDARFDDDHRPAVRPLLEQLERLRLALPEPTPAGQAASLPATEQVNVQAPTAAPLPVAAAAAASTAVDVPSGAAAPAQVANRADLSRFLSDVADSLRQTAASLREVDLKDPLGYLLPRVATALEVDETPPSEGGRTFLPAPDPFELKELQGMLDDGSWPELLKAAEGLARLRPLYLDVQRLVHTALDKLGDDYGAARCVVESELSALVQRMPELPDLAFSDGTPLADQDTTAWLRALSTSQGHSGAVDGSEDLQEPLQAARAMAISGSKDDAIEAFSSLLGRADGGRGRFRVRLAMAEALQASGEIALAVGLYGSLYTELESKNLDEWEPVLAGRCISGYHGCLPLAAAEGLNAAHESGAVFARLCRVDPKRVLKSPR